jgi:hypothetical protein
VRVTKPILLTLSIPAGLAVLVAIILLPAYAGAALTLSAAIGWCMWLERHPSVEFIDGPEGRVRALVVAIPHIVKSKSRKNIITIPSTHV